MSTQEYATAKWLLEAAESAPTYGIVEEVAKENTIRDLKEKLRNERFEKKLLPHEQTV